MISHSKEGRGICVLIPVPGPSPKALRLAVPVLQRAQAECSGRDTVRSRKYEFPGGPVL